MNPDPADAPNIINLGATETNARELAVPELAVPGLAAPEATASNDELRDLDLWVTHGVLPYRDAPEGPRLTVEERLGRAVLRLPLYRGWSQRDLQRTSGVHQSQISRLESGRQLGLSTRRLFAILRALHVGEIAFLPPEPALPPTGLELMLWGDQWERAGRAADRRGVNRRRSA